MLRFSLVQLCTQLFYFFCYFDVCSCQTQVSRQLGQPHVTGTLLMLLVTPVLFLQKDEKGLYLLNSTVTGTNARVQLQYINMMKYHDDIRGMNGWETC